MAFFSKRDPFVGPRGQRFRGSGLGGGVVEMAVFGDRALGIQLEGLGRRANPVTRTVLRKSARRLRSAIASRTPVDRGDLKREMKRAKIVSQGGRRGIRIGVAMPEREALGIPADAKGYYPAVIEYGSKKRGIPANSYIRGTVNAQEPAEIAQIAIDLGRAISREAIRLSRRRRR